MAGGRQASLHFHERQVVERQGAELGVEHFLVEFLVATEEFAELLVALQQGFDGGLRLVLEHGGSPRSGNAARSGGDQYRPWVL